MSSIDSIGATASRGSPSATQAAISAKSGAAKAQAMQSGGTSAAAAPVETVQAVAQSQQATKTRLTNDQRLKASPEPSVQQVSSQSQRSRAATSLSRPMTAALLQEMRLQQQLADVQEEMGREQETRKKA